MLLVSEKSPSPDVTFEEDLPEEGEESRTRDPVK